MCVVCVCEQVAGPAGGDKHTLVDWLAQRGEELR